MGAIVKSGTAPIAGVPSPGEKPKTKGLTYAPAPASDFGRGTRQLAAGMNLNVFTTGRGTPYGLAAVPVIDVATRSEPARRWHDLKDIDAGSRRRRHGQHRRPGPGALPLHARRGQRQ